jgi:opacity protein-like surface antigen
VRKVLLVAALAAAVLVPAASADRSHHVNLALVPLPKQALGPAAQGFGLAHASGPVSNASAASHTPDASAATFKKLGRIGGYALEYGNAFTGATGLADVRTSIEQYKTAADARKALAFWAKEDAALAALNQPGFSVTSAPVNVPAVGKTKRFAYLTSYSASNIAPVSGLDEQIADGRFILDVIVTAGTPAIAEALAPKLAKKLDARLHLALRGRFHRKPVKLRKLKAGPPRGGPDLSVLALRKSDLVGEATVNKAYVTDPAAISDYSVFMLPAGQFDALDQEIEWFPVANEASFFADFVNASALAAQGTTAVDLSTLGDGAQGSITRRSSLSTGLVVFSSGKLAEFIFLGSQGAIDPAGVTSVAQAAANRIDAAGLGTG